MVAIEWFLAGVIATGAVGSVVVFFARDLAVPWFLDKIKANRERVADLEREERAREREDAPVRERIIHRIRTLVRALQRVFVRGAFTIEEWQSWHNEIYGLVDSDAGARALGHIYRDLMEALNYDQLSINVQISFEARASEEQTSAGRMTPGRIAFLQRVHDAQLTQNVATVVLRFIPILIALGEEEADNEFGAMARDALSLADRTLTDFPP